MKNLLAFVFLLCCLSSSAQRLIWKSRRDSTVPYITSNLPILKIDVLDGTGIVDTNKRATLRILDRAENRSISNEYTFTSLVKIKTRGSISSLPQILKKQYAIGMLDSAGAGVTKSLFGLPADEDWILQSNYFDRAQIRNVFGYELVRALGYYSPRTVPVEVFINGAYFGVHAVMEKIVRSTGRVNIGSTSAASPNGGYLFKKDHLDDPTDSVWYSSIDGHTNFVTVYPKPSGFNATVKSFIKNKTDSFEILLTGSGFDNATTGWGKYGDRAAFADWILFHELFKSLDFYCYSMYFSRAKDGKITPFPGWDMDWTFGDGEIDSSSSPTGWWYNSTRAGQEGLHWPGRMMSGPTFLTAVKVRWATLRTGPLAQDSLFTMIDRNAATISARGAIARNYQKWPEEVGNQHGIASYFSPPVSWAAEVANIKAWLLLRLAWMDSQLQ